MEDGIYFFEEKTIIVSETNQITLIYDFFNYKSSGLKYIKKPLKEVSKEEIFGKKKVIRWDGLGRIIDLA